MKESLENVEIKPFGDSALIVKFGSKINPKIAKYIQSLQNKLNKTPFTGYIESVPSYTNLTIYYSAISIYRDRKFHPFQFIKEYIEELLESINLLEETSSKLIEIPVCYGGDYGPDLELVAMQNNITMEEVIEIHSQPEYLVHMIGFAPGFAFLGGMDEKIGTSRKDVPRLKIPAGSVGIAGKQTGIYPFETPGGWQLIGRTPTKLFLPEVQPPSLLTAGDKIRFYPITEKEYKQLGGQNQ
ncbi:5-oxoprolinase subunit PxpB [Rummeliibacillus sp. TYF005]|uniref:5-oxoprolinase subunit PxpB n=1 Tax=Rummeliibacillus sp. TYF005 TaxID=2058214 RepID=UPI000F52BE0B|nr:5-oxoprolinase subunit PxpB [Rummeliibacillus sp. TYF005]RPJ93961.1 5-oxoprolinase subunit PxpB [Rummeliibacillus sp. TYF005]